MIRSVALLLLLVPACVAQSATVANAVGSVSSRINTVSPGMLATLSQTEPGIGAGLIFAVRGVPALAATTPVSDILIRPAGSTTTLPVDIVSTAAGTATFIVPPTLPPGGAEVLWRTAGIYRATAITVAQSNFELLQAGPGGPATARVASSLGLLFDVGLAAPAMPGQTIFLSGSGLGTGTPVAASVSGVAAAVTFAGRDGRHPGYDQVQLRLPAGIPDNCVAPLTLTIGSATVNSSISITSDGAACRHPFQLSKADLITLDGGGGLAVGQIRMQSDAQAVLETAASRAETAGFSSTSWNLASLRPASSGLISGCGEITSPGAWFAVPVLRTGDFSTPSTNPAPPPVDAGKNLMLQNGTITIALSGSSPDYFAALKPAPEASLSNLPASVLMPGKWLWSSPGSADLDASSFGFSLPAPLRLAAGAPLTLRRDQDRTISWNGADSGSSASVTITLTGHGPDGFTPRTVSCAAAASAGSLTIPAALLAPFAAPSIGTLRAELSPAFDSLPHTAIKTKKGGTLLLYVTYSSTDSRPVDFH